MLVAGVNSHTEKICVYIFFILGIDNKGLQRLNRNNTRRLFFELDAIPKTKPAITVPRLS
jgi:hypothetical protein